MSLFVGNISPHVQHRQLENAFRRFGRSNLELKDGYGFVVYEEYRDAERALRTLQGRIVCGERLSLSWARRRRPFQRFSGAGNSFRRDSWDKDQDRVSRRRSLGLEKGPADDGKEHRASDELQDGSRASETREDDVGKIAKEDWRSQGEEKLEFDGEGKDTDPLDNGRWGEPLSEGSPERMDDGPRDDGEDGLDEKEKEDNEGSVHEKSHGSPVDKGIERTSRAFHNSDDQSKRGRDAFGKAQERCFHCGHLGHIMRQCRSRMNMNMYPRDSFDGRRNQFRNIRGVGFRGMGGRFRGMDGTRRVFNRDLEGSYGTRILRRRGSAGDRMHEQVDTRDESRRRHHRSESRKDSSRERSKRKRKKSSKKSSRSTRKRQRSSSDSPSVSPSRSQSSSSSPAHSRSRSHSRSHSRSRSLASRSRSKSRSRSSSSVSHSHKSGSRSSRSHSVSASSRSRSRSASSHSERSPSKSQSRSSKSQSRSVSRSHSLPLSRSPDSPGLPSQPSIPLARDSTSSRGNSEERSRSSKFSRLQSKEFEVGSAAPLGSQIQEKQVSRAGDAEKEEKQVSRYSSEDQDMNEQYVKRKERKRHGFKESKKQKDRTSSDVEGLHCEGQTLANGRNLNSENNKQSWDYNRQDHMSSPRLARGQGNLKSTEPEPSSFPAGDIHGSTYSAYMAVQSRVVHTDDNQHLNVPRFGAARLWPWDALLYQRLKRGPVSVANYERRKLQNEEFGIVDKFVRSSSGWWENHSE